MIEAISDWGASAPSGLSFRGTGSSGPANLGAGLSFFDVKIHEVAPSDVSGMDASQIMNILHNLDVDGVREAAAAHTALGEQLQRVADKLVQNAHTLAQSWKGSAAQAAMNKFQQMHAQTAQLAAQAKQTGQVLHWTAAEMQKFKNLPAPHGMSAVQADEHTGAAIGGAVGGVPGAAIGDAVGGIAGAIGIGGGGQQAKANAQAQKYLHALNQQLVAANNALPTTIGQGPGPHIGNNNGLGPAGAGGGVSGGGVASGPGLSPYSGAGAGSGTGSGAPAHIGKFNAVQPHSGNSQSIASLQSVAPSANGGTATLPPPGNPVTAAPGVPTNMPTMVPSGPVPNVGNGPASAKALAEEGTLPASEGAAAEGSAVDGAAGAGAADGAAADGMGAEGMMPMSGMGAAGQASEAAAGESLLDTETNPAFADAAAGSGAGGAIGDEIGAAEGEGMFPMTGGGASQRDRERQRQAWMNEDDIWGLPKDSVSSVIEGK